jgi:hypothetical protein
MAATKTTTDVAAASLVQRSWVVVDVEKLVAWREDEGLWVQVVPRNATGRGLQRQRSAQFGDHLPLDSRLREMSPEAFAASLEPADCLECEFLSTEEQARRQREASRRVPLIVTEQSLVCRRCGWRGGVAIMPPPVTHGEATVEGMDLDEREATIKKTKHRVTELLSARRLWQDAQDGARSHVCPPDSPADDELPDLPIVQKEAERVRSEVDQAYEVHR